MILYTRDKQEELLFFVKHVVGVSWRGQWDKMNAFGLKHGYKVNSYAQLTNGSPTAVKNCWAQETKPIYSEKEDDDERGLTAA